MTRKTKNDKNNEKNYGFFSFTDQETSCSESTPSPLRRKLYLTTSLTNLHSAKSSRHAKHLFFRANFRQKFERDICGLESQPSFHQNYMKRFENVAKLSTNHSISRSISKVFKSQCCKMKSSSPLFILTTSPSPH